MVEEVVTLLRHDIENMRRWSTMKKIAMLLFLLISGAVPTIAIPGASSDEPGLTFRSLRGLQADDPGALQCANITTCYDCVDTIVPKDGIMVDCVWCAPEDGYSSCVDATELSEYCPLDSDQFVTCDSYYYTYIFIVVLSVLVCLCLCTCYMRRQQGEINPTRLLLPSAARHFLWRSEPIEGSSDWMCIICGFDNKSSNDDCIMCGTSHQFSINYKAEKREQQNGEISGPSRNKETKHYDFGSPKRTSPLRPGRGDDGMVTPPRQNSSDVWREVAGRGASIDSAHSRSFTAGIGGLSSHQLEALQVAATPPRTSRAERDEALNYRRLNQLSLRQKAGRRRRMWQRVHDPETGGLKWVRAPPQNTIVADVKMGYTPRPSFDGAAAVAEAAGEMNMASTIKNGNLDGYPGDHTPRNVSVTSSGAEWLGRLFGMSAVNTSTANQGQDSSSAGRLTADSRNENTANAAGEVANSEELRRPLLDEAESGDPVNISSMPKRRTASIPVPKSGDTVRSVSTDSFGDSVLLSGSPGFTTVFDSDKGILQWEKVEPGLPVTKMKTMPSKVDSSDYVPEQKDNSKPPKAPDYLLSTLMKELETVDLVAITALTFKEKQLWFLDQMGKIQKPWADGCVRMEVDRDDVMKSSLDVFGRIPTGELHKWIRVQFKGEPGVDAGGLEREWFTLIVTELFEASTGLFTCTSSESLGGAYHINPTSGRSHPDDHLKLLTLAGRVMGKAIMEQQAIAATLSLPLRKQILTLPVTFSDLEFVDPILYRNLKFLETYDEIESLTLDFTVSYPVIRGDDSSLPNIEESVVHELKPGGSNIAVTRENRDEYLQLLLENRMLGSVKEQVEHLLSGLYEVIPPDLLSIFDYQELELLMCGVPDIDIKDWKLYTEYMGGYSSQGAKHKVIKWFWKFVESCSSEEKARLVQFVTGCSRLPAQGFRALVSNDGKLRNFNIQSVSKKDSVYPRSHTCFNKLDLPMYESKSELETYMSCITSGDVFGFTIE